MNFKKESFGLSSFVIVVETELNALKSNKHIIYSSLLTPILYYVFYAIGIQSTFGDIYFHGQYMSFFVICICWHFDYVLISTNESKCL